MIAFVVLVMITCVSRGTAEYFSSSSRMAELSKSEEKLLSAVKLRGLVKEFSLQDLLATRQSAISLTGGEASLHPNGAYLLIKAFLDHWNNVIDKRTDLKSVLLNPELPTSVDLDGTLVALIRLQRLYNLTAAQIYSGNISGFSGPALSPPIAFELGRRAFMDGSLSQSADWLNLAYAQMTTTNPSVGVPGLGYLHGADLDNSYSATHKAEVLSLLGRVYVRLNNKARAKELLRQSASLADTADANELQKELTKGHFPSGSVFAEDAAIEVMRELCTRDKTNVVGHTRPFHRCRYKSSLHVPFRKYKEEIISLSPFASIFHDVLYDSEIDFIISHSKAHMHRSGLHPETNLTKTTPIFHSRVSNTQWITDSENALVRRVSRRVMDITWLHAEDNDNNLKSPAEALQVLNYGLGGHYSSHYDFLPTNSVPRLQASGNRIATFLLYLSDVEVGGHTIFLEANISVPSVKGQALFWYNMKPNGEEDYLTLHAGCPVLKGHKWIANKWIWIEGNMYTRPCGPRPDSSQLELEKIMYSRRRNIYFP